MKTYEFVADWVSQHKVDGQFRVLDYGCGAGQIVGLLRDRGLQAFGCDVFYEGGDYSNDVPPALRSQIRRMQQGTIPFEDHSFDVVISNQVFEHVSDMEA